MNDKSNQFKSWLSDQPKFTFPARILSKEPKKDQNDLNSLVESRLGLQRLENQISTHNNTFSKDVASHIAKEFKENGGKIVGIEDWNLLIEVGETKFSLPKMYVKIQ